MDELTKKRPRRLFSKRSSSSEEMETLRTFEGLLKLGKMIETEVGADKGVDTLGRWLSHYLAEQLNEAKKDPSKQDKCVDLILKLWRHREFYQHRPRPLEEYNKIINVLESLDPQKDETFYFTHYQEQESQEKNSTWLSLALEIDQIARALISLCLAQGVKDAELSKDPWLEAAKDLKSDKQIILLNHLSKLEEPEFKQ